MIALAAFCGLICGVVHFSRDRKAECVAAGGHIVWTTKNPNRPSGGRFPSQGPYPVCEYPE